jgi:hypothetical protein
MQEEPGFKYSEKIDQPSLPGLHGGLAHSKERNRAKFTGRSG